MSDDRLPVAPLLTAIVEASRAGPLIVTAPPGSGKTTLVPPALLRDLSEPHPTLILVQPRRLAARAVAQRIAQLEQVKLGERVGYQVRFERCASAATRLMVVTTGILLRRLSDDLDLQGVGAVVLDEFHERTLEMDTALGFLQRIRETLRPDLRVVVMSATLDAQALADRIGSATIFHTPGVTYPVEVHYVPRRDREAWEDSIGALLPRVIERTTGHVLIFLPGVGEIMRCRDRLSEGCRKQGLDLMPLYGDLRPEEQDAVLAPALRRKVILSTNVAETSVTIAGVTAVIDTGMVRELRVHPAVGLPCLELVPISRASADQRAGRAGRTAPGECWRLWDQTAHRARAPQTSPEIVRSDLAQMVLQLRGWGEHEIAAFPWLDLPPADAVADAELLLRRLGACDPDGRLTPWGDRLLRIPTHPRLAQLLLTGADRGVLEQAALAAALLTERDPFRAGLRRTTGPRDSHTVRTDSDLTDRVRALQQFKARQAPWSTDLPLDPPLARQVLRVAEQLARLAGNTLSNTASNSACQPPEDPDTTLQQVLLAAFPDRLARLRPQSHDRGVMVGGRGVRLTEESQVRGAPLFLCLVLQAGSGDARVTMASAVDRSWLPEQQLQTRDELFFNPSRGQVEARRRTYWEDLCLDETPVAIDDQQAAAEILAEVAFGQRQQLFAVGKDPASRFRQRVLWLAQQMPDLDFPPLDDQALRALLTEVCAGLRSLDELRKTDWLPHFQRAIGYERLAELDRHAPATCVLPTGRPVPLEYELGHPPILAARIQEFFGWRETPRIAGGRVALRLHLLGPNYRPQQITEDLASFWENTYPVIRKELRRRYPKHAWPEDPRSDPSAPSRRP